MSELIQKHDNRATIRWKLLTGASALALVASAATANADDDSRPTIWIELGGQAEAVSGQGQLFAAPFMTTDAASPVFNPVSPLDVEKPPRYSFGGEAAISFQPEDSNWIFSAGIRYGRSNNRRNFHQQTRGVPVPTTSAIYQFLLYYGDHFSYITLGPQYADTQAHHSESHTILDFQVGKDVGLGMFGRDGTSIISAGFRMARFNANATVDVNARPDNRAHFLPYPKYYFYFHNFSLAANSQRSFHGIGPSVSWSGSVPLVGDPGDGELALDWGINGAVLFGKQRAKVHHNTTGHYFNGKYGYHKITYQTSANPMRSRNVIVPNIGGSAGISYQFTDAKLSLGYRTDYFFGAMDGGIDTAKKSTLSFNGPYASISIGLGD